MGDLCQVPKDALGREYYLLLRELLSGYLYTAVLPDTTSATVEAQLLAFMQVVNVIPNFIVSDAGTHFAGAFHTRLKAMGIHHVVNTPGVHEATGAAECAIRAVNDALVSLLASFGFAERQWSDWLPYVTLVLNNTPTERLGGATPAAVMGRREIAMTDLVGRARALTTDTGPPTPLTPEQFADMAKQAHAKLDAVERAALETSVARRNAAHAARMAKSHVVLTSDDIDVGDFVLVSTDGFPTTSTSKLEAKLSTHWTGPFIAVALERPYVWRVRQLGGTAEYCLHLKYLRPYRPPTARRPWRRS